jgi:hypothetical protein
MVEDSLQLDPFVLQSDPLYSNWMDRYFMKEGGISNLRNSYLLPIPNSNGAESYTENRFAEMDGVHSFLPFV